MKLDHVECCPADAWNWVGDNTLDAIVTSPPFETMRRYSDDPRDLGHYRGEEFVNRLKPVLAEWLRVLKPTGNLFLNFLPQSLGGMLSPASWLLPRALGENGFHLVQELWVVKTNAMPIADQRLLKPCVERVLHAVKDPPKFLVYKDSVRRPALWSARDRRSWKYSTSGADQGNYLSPALERLNKLSIREVLSLACGEQTNALPIAKTQDQATVHPARMADEVARWLVLYGSPPGGVVGDGFCGSGTSLIQAKSLGRHFLGGDINARYVEQTRTALEGINFGELLSAEGKPTRPELRRALKSPLPAPAPTNCPHCGKPYSLKRRWQKFCSDGCRFAHHNEIRRKHGKEADVDRSSREAKGGPQDGL